MSHNLYKVVINGDLHYVAAPSLASAVASLPNAERADMMAENILVVSSVAAQLNPEDLIEGFCKFYRLDRAHLFGPEKTPRLARHRAALVYVLRDKLGASLTELSDLTHKDRCTVSLQYRKGLEQMTAGRGPIYELVTEFNNRK